MEHDLSAPDCCVNALVGLDVALDDVDVSGEWGEVGSPACREVVERTNIVTSVQEGLHEMRADETRPAGYQDAQAATIATTTAARVPWRGARAAGYACAEAGDESCIGVRCRPRKATIVPAHRARGSVADETVRPLTKTMPTAPLTKIPPASTRGRPVALTVAETTITARARDRTSPMMPSSARTRTYSLCVGSAPKSPCRREYSGNRSHPIPRSGCSTKASMPSFTPATRDSTNRLCAASRRSPMLVSVRGPCNSTITG